MTCTYEGCGRRVKAVGYCTGHYRQWLHADRDPTALRPIRPRQPAECTGPVCDRRPVARGYCDGHYNQWITRDRDPSRLTPLKRDTTRHHRLAPARIEDALWLLDAGTHPSEVARRVGYASVSSLEAALQRRGYRVPAVAAEASYERRHLAA